MQNIQAFSELPQEVIASLQSLPTTTLCGMIHGHVKGITTSSSTLIQRIGHVVALIIFPIFMIETFINVQKARKIEILNAINVVDHNGMYLRDFPQHIKNNIKVVRAAYLQNREALRFANRDLQGQIDPGFISEEIFLDLKSQTSEGLHEGRITVFPQRLASNPENYLAVVAKHDFTRVEYRRSDGSFQAGGDAGGLSKQFVIDLTEALLEREVIQRTSCALPASTKLDLSPYMNFGKFLSRINKKNLTTSKLNARIYVGEIFNPKTFQLLQILAQSQTTSETEESRKTREFLVIANVIREETSQLPSNQRIHSLINFLNKSSYTDLDRTSIKEVLGLAGELTDENLRNACFEALGIQYTHRALSAILSGLDEDLKAKILARGVAMSVEIQGGINEEQLLDKLVPSENDPLQALNVRIGWIKDKIREEFGKPRSDWVKRFLKCITGQPVLPAGNIKILVAQGVLCKANTCFNSLEIPLSCNIPPRNEPSLPPLSDKERFIENLEILMAQTDFELL